VSAIPCPVCGSGQLERFLRLPAVPVLSTVFYPDSASARDAPAGDLDLALCRSCALVWNVAFEPERVEYTPDYENSQHFSPAFRSYTDELARRLAETYGLRGRTVVEIGSGKGEFLSQLCDVADCRGIGFDPTFDGDVEESRGRVTILRRYYDAEAARDLAAALVLARHVLEHLADPLDFLIRVREAGTPDTAVYFEVPNAGHVFGEAGMWDLIYQHVGYFSAPTLELLLRRAGYAVTDIRAVFHGQFLGVEGRPGAAGTLPDEGAVERACATVDRYAERLDQRLEAWRARLNGVDGDGKVVLWGAGAKGVAFLNLLGIDDAIDRVVDINPRKRGRFIPGTGHLIEAPDVLRGGDTSSVLILNPAYKDEIRTHLHSLGLRADVLTV
jgi:hypothetical protein